MSNWIRRRSKRLAAGLALAGLAVLSGCAWLPDETPRARFLSSAELGLPADGSAAGARYPWPQPEWWRRFRDPGLNALMATALADNPSLKNAAHRLRQVQALSDRRAAELLPLVESGLSVSGQRFSANSVQAKLAGETFGLAIINPIELSYHLDLWGRDRAALEEALGLAEAERAEVLEARLLLAAAVARAYLRLGVAVEQQALAETMADTLRERLRLLRVRFDQGLDGKRPLETAEARLRETEQGALGAASRVKLLRHQLAALAGKGPAWGETLRPPAAPAPEVFRLPEALPLHLLARRPDVLAARRRAEAAAKAIEVAKTAFYPDVNIRGFAGLHSVSLVHALFQGSSLAFAVGPTVELPLFEGGRLKANLEVQQAAYDGAVEAYNAALVQAVRQAADALTRLEDIERRKDAQAGSVAALAENHRLADWMKTQGLADRVQLLESRYVRDAQNFRLKELEAEQALALIDLIEALGGGHASLEVGQFTDEKRFGS
jgi:NodT family efflux transporter outer membrane factor (OMF) lipoprotein